MKKTRQGVRDLNHIKAKSVGIRLDMPPEVEDKEASTKQKKALNEMQDNIKFYLDKNEVY